MRLRAFVTAAALPLTLMAATVAPVSAASSAAGTAPRDRVRPSDLPTHAQVARIYDGLEDGHRLLFRNRRKNVRSEDCIGVEDGPRAASGRWAGYVDASGESPYFAGLTDATVFVYKFSTRARTRHVMATLRADARRCEGNHSDVDIIVDTELVRLPSLGAARFGVRERQTFAEGEEYFLDVWVRQGRYLVNTRAQADTFRPGKHRLVRLTRVALRRAG